MTYIEKLARDLAEALWPGCQVSLVRGVSTRGYRVRVRHGLTTLASRSVHTRSGAWGNALFDFQCEKHRREMTPLGTPPDTYIITECTGVGFGLHGCNAKVKVTGDDVFQSTTTYGDDSTEDYTAFVCQTCGWITGCNGFPFKNIPTASEWAKTHAMVWHNCMMVPMPGNTRRVLLYPASLRHVPEPTPTQKYWAAEMHRRDYVARAFDARLEAKYPGWHDGRKVY